MTNGRGSLVAAAVFTAVVVIVGSRARPEVASSPLSDRAAFVVLLESNSLLGVAASGKIVWRTPLGPHPKQSRGGRYVTLVGNDRLAVVAPGPKRDRLALVSRSGRVLRRAALPANVRFAAIAHRTATGRFYLAGDVPTRRRTQFESFAHVPLVAVLSDSGAVIARERLHGVRGGTTVTGPLDWRVHGLAVSPDGARMFVSYHGPNTGGADWVDVGGRSLTACASSPAERTCIPDVHGSVEADGGGILATLGTPPLVARFSRDSRRTSVWSTALKNAHLMEFARAAQTVYVVESCTKTGGLAVVELANARTRLLARPAAVAPLRGLGVHAVCGERIAVSRGRIAVMKRGTISGIAGVMLINDDGRSRKWLPLSPPPVDLVALRTP